MINKTTCLLTYLSYVEPVTLWAQTCSHELRVNYSPRTDLH